MEVMKYCCVAEDEVTSKTIDRKWSSVTGDDNDQSGSRLFVRNHLHDDHFDHLVVAQKAFPDSTFSLYYQTSSYTLMFLCA